LVSKYPLTNAINNKNVEMIDLLLDHGADVNMKDKKLNSILHIAIEENKTNHWLPAAILLKIANKANTHDKNIYNVSPMELLKQYQLLSGIIKDNTKNITISESISESTSDSANDQKREYSKHKYGLFNADIRHGCIYTQIFLQKFNNLTIPSDTLTNIEIEKKRLDTMNFYRTKPGRLITDLLYGFVDNSQSLLPYVIVYYDDYTNYSYYDDYDYDDVDDKIVDKNKRFVMFKLSLIIQDDTHYVLHANMLLLDRNTHIIYRFDPYGGKMNMTMIENKNVDEYIKNKFKKYKYTSPTTYQEKARFQLISNESEPENKRFGDPFGYCLAWCYWFIEIIMEETSKDTLKEIDMEKILNNEFDKLLKKYVSLTDFIRDYAISLDTMKNEYLKKHGVSEDLQYVLSP